MAEQKNTENKTVEQNSTPTKKRDIKKTLKSFLALVLVAVISIVGTWAYLNKKSERIPNTFVGSKGLNLLLQEEKYDADKTKKYSPGMTYDKDPVLYNNTTTDSGDGDYYEWVAMRVDYIINENSNVDKDGNPTGLQAGVVTREAIMGNTAPNTNGIIESIDFDTTKWERLTLSGNPTYEIYVYKYQLKNDSTKTTYTSTTTSNNATAADEANTDGSRTTPLFTQVKLFEQSVLASHGYADDKLPKFTISVLGAAIKVEDDIDINKFDLQSTTAATKTASENIKAALVDLLDDETLTAAHKSS